MKPVELERYEVFGMKMVKLYQVDESDAIARVFIAVDYHVAQVYNFRYVSTV